MYERETIREEMAKVLAHLLREHGASGGFANEEGFMIQEDECDELARGWMDHFLDMIEQDLWNFDWIGRAKRLRKNKEFLPKSS